MSTMTTSVRTSCIWRSTGSVGLVGKPYVAEDIPAHPGSLQTVLEYRQPFSVFGQESYRYALHRLTCYLYQHVIEK